MKLYLIKLGAFIKKDFQIESSYKLPFILGIVGGLFPIFSYFFIITLFCFPFVVIDGYELITYVFGNRLYWKLHPLIAISSDTRVPFTHTCTINQRGELIQPTL